MGVTKGFSFEGYHNRIGALYGCTVAPEDFLWSYALKDSESRTAFKAVLAPAGRAGKGMVYKEFPLL